MAANTGRTVSKYTTVHIDNAGAVLTQLTSVNSIGGLGLEFEEVDLTAWADAVKGVLLDRPDFTTTLGGVFSTADHAVLSAINGLNVPLAFDVRVGIRQAYQAGEPQFGITGTATDGVLVKNYKVNLADMTWTADISMAAGSAAPAWGTAAET